MSEEPLSRTAASGAVEDIGWRYLVATLATTVAVNSMRDALQVVAAAITACGTDADGHLRTHLRGHRVDLVLQSAASAQLTARDVDLAHDVSRAIRALGRQTAPTADARAVQSLEIGIDAMDIAAIRPFWRAVLAYADEPGNDGPEDQIVDPTGEGPVIWFQQMTEPRPQRNRIHLDITVPHDEAEARLQAALTAGGALLSDTRARAFWVVADPEGNEARICTWQDRDRVAD